MSALTSWLYNCILCSVDVHILAKLCNNNNNHR